jgi:hypothetical protein
MGEPLTNPFVSQLEDGVLGMIENDRGLVFFLQSLVSDLAGSPD